MAVQYAVSEVFTSPQGEGLYTGTLMTFVRMAGCTVGRPYRESVNAPVWQAVCKTYDGRKFLCDTDFRKKLSLTAEAIRKEVPEGVQHVCITGGEPLNQPLGELIHLLISNGIMVHIETSGTVSIWKAFPEYAEVDALPFDDRELWITVSPKFGLLNEMVDVANEIKLLVDSQFDENAIPQTILEHPMVWIQPINSNFDVNRGNLTRCLDIIKRHPKWRLSTQMHKIWNVR